MQRLRRKTRRANMGAAAIPLPIAMEFEAAEQTPCVTLLELVEAVSCAAHNDREVVATVLHMLRRGSVQLRGSFRDEPIEKF
jgi:hypothetical protein